LAIITDHRFELLTQWLTNELNLVISTIEPASADASFRRYFRTQTDRGIFIVMDAPPEKEPLVQFIAVAQALSQQGVHSPQIIEKNQQQGFLLLEDLGHTTYLNELRTKPDELYCDATDALIKIQQGNAKQNDLTLPSYDAAMLAQEMELFSEWFMLKHLGIEMDESLRNKWATTKQLLIDACIEQPQVWVHRDYHCRNLMITTNHSPGVIDFQDMVVGPIAYDLASIYKDCYIQWPRQQQLIWLEEYRSKALKLLDLTPFSQSELIRWYDLTGLQRHLKVLGIFCRLYYRDGKAQYLDDLPLVAKYVLEVLDLYPQLQDFKISFADHIKKAL